MHTNSHKVLRAVGALIATVTLVFTAACGNSSSSSNAISGLTPMTGVSAQGKLGSKPTVKFKTPFKVTNNSYQIIQKGDGATFKEGQKLCMQQIVFDPKTGKQVSSTWENSADCTSTFSSKSMQSSFYNLFKQLRVNSTVALGISSSGSSTSSSSKSSSSKSSSTETTAYIMALTIVSAKTIPTRATGDKVTGIDASLPKITLAKNGAPSINAQNLKKYKSDGQLKVQTLIQGKGATVKETSTITAHYTGWVLGGDASKPFDSSWTRGAAATFSLQQVIKGWTQGLAGQKVGSQVLLIIPPSLGYGNQAQTNIPANSTLVFVVDILDAQ
ncbi:FKBP-type peptidyl-prolyl cis-trans isomerase [Alloscardovia venturai]|uniref:peptidylprolyl isomerase n=1 Tax=Alloscardovia venturai TaxID=1769421 RepID=A0ABW2Y6T7_9BIFI